MDPVRTEVDLGAGPARDGPRTRRRIRAGKQPDREQPNEAWQNAQQNKRRPREEKPQ